MNATSELKVFILCSLSIYVLTLPDTKLKLWSEVQQFLPTVSSPEMAGIVAGAQQYWPFGHAIMARKLTL